MDQYSFTIEITGGILRDPNFEDLLYEAGCRDAMVVMSDGKVMLDFDRYASSYESAVASAMRDLRNAGAEVGDATAIVD